MLAPKLASKQSGVGLIELMVSVTIGMLIMAGVVQLYLTSVEAQRSQEGVSRIQENMRYSSAKLTEEGATSGYLGCIERLRGSEEELLVNLLQYSGGGAAGAPVPAVDFVRGNVEGSEGQGVNNTDQVAFSHATASAVPMQQAELDVSDGSASFDNSDNYREAYNQFRQWDVAVLTNCQRAHVLLITDPPDGSGTIQFQAGPTAPASSANAGISNMNRQVLHRYYGQQYSSDDGSLRASLYKLGAARKSYEVRLSQRGQRSGASCDSDNPEYCALYRNGDEILEGVSGFKVRYGWGEGDLKTYGGANDVNAAGAWDSIERIELQITLTAPDSNSLNGDNIERTFNQVIMMRNTFRDAPLMGGS
ncbi:MAG: prepilin-type N-terminal cleavage/methylation domain-containing protein [Cellvibrionaceae bacterium]|nr:prepilin-type N-terminal cleavage/methylation domain-containing protein [Cellvibrionaceae bacterium]